MQDVTPNTALEPTPMNREQAGYGRILRACCPNRKAGRKVTRKYGTDFQPCKKAVELAP